MEGGEEGFDTWPMEYKCDKRSALLQCMTVTLGDLILLYYIKCP